MDSATANNRMNVIDYKQSKWIVLLQTIEMNVIDYKQSKWIVLLQTIEMNVIDYKQSKWIVPQSRRTNGLSPCQVPCQLTSPKFPLPSGVPASTSVSGHKVAVPMGRPTVSPCQVPCQLTSPKFPLPSGVIQPQPL